MKRFTTNRKCADGCTYSWYVDAVSWEEAQQLADARGLGEEVDGILYLKIDADTLTPGRVAELTQALADEDGEPPDAEEFDK